MKISIVYCVIFVFGLPYSLSCVYFRVHNLGVAPLELTFRLHVSGEPLGLHSPHPTIIALRVPSIYSRCRQVLFFKSP